MSCHGPNLDQERRQAHALLDLLPAEKLNAVRSLHEVMLEPLARSLALAEVEEEEITPETAAALDRARASLACGEGIPHEDIRREFGLNQLSSETPPERIAVIWSPTARAELRRIERDTAVQILYCIDRYLVSRTVRRKVSSSRR